MVFEISDIENTLDFNLIKIDDKKKSWLEIFTFLEKVSFRV